MQSSANILINKGIAKIADFGLSGNPNQESRCEGHAAYIDPMCFKARSYKRGKESDIFSLGVVLWEIASGQLPCKGHIQSHDIVLHRLRGLRDDDTICKIPKEYITLYSECWDENPHNRPSCEQVYRNLESLQRTNSLKYLVSCKNLLVRLLKVAGQPYCRHVIVVWIKYYRKKKKKWFKTIEGCHFIIVSVD